MKQGRIIAETGKPLQFLWAEEVDLPESAEQTNVVLIADTLKVYRKTTDDLLKGKYACFADIVPRHLKSPCDIFVLRCSDGVLVRYDTTTQEHLFIRAAVVDNSLRDMAFQFSEGILRLDTDPQDLHQDDGGLRLQIGVMDANGATTQTHMLTSFILASSQLPAGFQLPSPPARPICLVSLQSEFELEIGGHLVPVDITQRPDGSDYEQLIAHSRVQLPVGWLAIEVYPLLNNEYWQPEFAPMWAELDILAAAAQRNFSRETQLNALDSRGERRRYYAALLDEFDRLLQGPEEPVHQFLRKHPELICPTCEKYWSKLPFGSRVCDFVFREPYNDYELVELEAPIRPLFRKDGQQRKKLTHAVNQISDWITYIEDNKKIVEENLGLSGISTSPRTLIVIGRADSLTEENRRKLSALQNQISKLRILTYDDLLAAARANLERILGPLMFRGENVRLYFFK